MRIEHAENSAENRQSLAQAWGGNSESEVERMSREGIHGCGLPLQFWRINGASLLVTEKVGDTLHLIAYQGRNAVEMLRGMRKVARANNCRVIRYETQRRGFVRLFREFSPQNVGGDEWEIKV